MPVGNSKQSWGTLSIALHWLVALCVFGLFGLGFWMTGLDYYHAWYKQGPDLHKSIGIMLFLLLLFRLAWRLFNGHPDPLPTHTEWEKRLAHAVHLLLYLLLFAIMTSGYFISTADGRAIPVFDWFALPAYPLGIEQQEEIAGTIHWYLALTLMSLVGLHAVGALKHHFIDKDETLKRMFYAQKTN
ncbi:MAG: cytochrome b [Chromatiaceae bacterium]|nr:cytochrome b [Gammaproteobacteria bacterium]MCP5426899.1 cytochrome b [Chromatiaceae bacterium]MCB1871463.1 cytochrome b [Gammaproteobacteria bacterium]MCB1880202.1 cytochrome b [Gammaproteobacteria bacterium]MCB1903729.1 cytochrome b [Gammaproteobacteria bacterium]